MKPGRRGHACLNFTSYNAIMVKSSLLSRSSSCAFGLANASILPLSSERNRNAYFDRLLSYNLANCHKLAFHHKLHDLPLSYKINLCFPNSCFSIYILIILLFFLFYLLVIQVIYVDPPAIVIKTLQCIMQKI